MAEWKIGDRVTRSLFMDDGTWTIKGDKCLSDSPLRHGTVAGIRVEDESDLILYTVRWDEGRLFPSEHCRYYYHGLDKERPNG